MARSLTTQSLPVRVLAYGTDEPLPEREPVRAGPLTMIFEAGDLRSVRLGDREILRRVYVAVRDRNWDTVPAVLADVRIERGSDWFAIAFRAEHRQDPVDFAWVGTIRGDSAGTITYTMEGTARSTFLRNRIGICVHHPIRECAGLACVVEHDDGSIERGAFPQAIAPHQPFRMIRAIAHEVAPGLRAEVRFAGEVFEMEDQRNWTDASFKTYSTPLEWPFPVAVPAGTSLAQSVVLTLQPIPLNAEDGIRPPLPPGEGRGEGRVAGTGDVALTPTLAQGESGPDDDDVAISVRDDPAVPLPPLGLGLASHGRPLRPEEVACLKALRLSHLRLDLVLSRADFPATLQGGAADAAAVGVPLELALFLSDRATQELEALLEALAEVRPVVRHWLIFHLAEKSTAARWIRLAREHLTRFDPAARIGAGTNAYFAELNRDRPPVDDLDVVAYSLNPRVHAVDNDSLVENLGAQAVTVASALRFVGGRPIVVGPITLKPRFNPNATGPEPAPPPGELPSQVDPRQMSLFGAGWTLGSLKELSLAGASSLTYFETTGWRGVMETAEGSPLPSRFRSLPSAVFPLYHVLADVGEFAGGEVVPVTSADPERLHALALRRGDRSRVLLANLGPRARRVRVVGLAPEVRVRTLDETNAIEAMREPEAYRAQAGDRRRTSAGAIGIDLPPYGLVRIDGGGED